MEIMIGLTSKKTKREIKECSVDNVLPDTIGIGHFIMLDYDARLDCLSFGIMSKQDILSYTIVAFKVLIKYKTTPTFLANLLEYIIENRDIKVSELINYQEALDSMYPKNKLVFFLINALNKIIKHYRPSDTVDIEKIALIFEFIEEIEDKKIVKKIMTEITKSETDNNFV